MSALPSGTVTFLFTDIEGSTRLFERHPEAMKEALVRHNALLQRSIGAHRGHVFQVQGDGFCAAFEESGDALEAALDAQRALHEERWGDVGAVRVRMGLHTGSVEARGGEYDSSLTLARVQRVMSAGTADRRCCRRPRRTASGRRCPRERRCAIWVRTSCAA
jgi:class 3 adenylate cyclase